MVAAVGSFGFDHCNTGCCLEVDTGYCHREFLSRLAPQPCG